MPTNPEKNENESKAAQTDQAPPLTPSERAALHEAAALIIFEHDCPLVPGRGGEFVARRCFAYAKPFVEMAERVRAGFDPGNGKPPAPEMVEVKYDDPDTGEVVTRMESLQDFFLPNMPASHPINQRSTHFRKPPPDGIAGTPEALALQVQ
jgi:hypothetical protein